MRKRSLLFAVVVFGFVLCGTAFADWSQQFNQSGTETYSGTPVGEFDRIGIWWDGGDKFSTPAFNNFSDSAWNNYNVSDASAYAIGAVTTNLNFNISFLGDQSAGTKFYFMAANGSDIRQRQYAEFDGSNWSVSYGTSFPEVSPENWKGGTVVTPEPVSSALFLLGGATLVVYQYRRKKKKSA
jgi:hypothetical protein